MAYDPADAADKKIVKDLIDAALKTANEEHETEITGLKTKNTELLAKIKKGETNSTEVEALEKQVEDNQVKIKELTKTNKSLTTELTDTKATLESESKFTHKLVGENGLTDALAKVGVAPQFMDAVKALLGPTVQVKIDGDTRKAVVGDKPVEAFVTEWAQGDTGKNFIAAANNSGTGGPGNKIPHQPTGKTLTRAAFEAMPVTEHGAFFSGGGTLTDQKKEL